MKKNKVYNLEIKEYKNTVHDDFIKAYQEGNAKEYISEIKEYYTEKSKSLKSKKGNYNKKLFIVKLIEDKLKYNDLDPIIFSKKSLKGYFKIIISMGFYMEEINKKYVSIFLDDYSLEERLIVKVANNIFNSDKINLKRFTIRVNPFYVSLIEYVRAHRSCLNLIKLFYEVDREAAIRMFGNEDPNEISIKINYNIDYNYFELNDIVVDCLKQKCYEIKEIETDSIKRRRERRLLDRRISLQNSQKFINNGVIILPPSFCMEIAKTHCETAMVYDLSDKDYYEMKFSSDRRTNIAEREMIKSIDNYYYYNRVFPRINATDVKRYVEAEKFYYSDKIKNNIPKIKSISIFTESYCGANDYGITLRIELWKKKKRK